MSVLATKTLGECEVCGWHGTLVKMVGNRDSIRFCYKCEPAIIEAIKVKAKEIKETKGGE